MVNRERLKVLPRVLLIIPSVSYRATDFMKAAERLGIDVVVGSDRSQPLEALAPGRSLSLDLSAPDAGAIQIQEFAKRYPLDAVIAVDDVGTLVAVRAAQSLGLPHNPFSAVEATRNKHLLRQRLARGELLSPRYRVLSVDDDCHRSGAQIGEQVGFPCVVKPLSLSGSRGVIRANNPEEFVDAFERLRTILADPEVAADCGDTAANILVEAYIPGQEVSLEGLVIHGEVAILAIFDKPNPLEGPFFEETIYITPSRLPSSVQDEVAGVTQSSVDVLGLLDGPIHAELRVNEEGVWPIDIAARSIGGLCSRALFFGVEGLEGDMSLEELILRHATNTSQPYSNNRDQSSTGVMMIPIPAPGRLTAIHGVEHAEAVAGINEVTMMVRPGDSLVPLPEGDQYLGFILARAESPASVESALRAAHAQLSFDVVENDYGS